MNRSDDKETILIRYLLGELSEEEQDRIEDGYLGDEESFERLLAVEDELIDAYVRGRLSAAKRERFEQYFLRSPERRERVKFAETWKEYITRLPDSAESSPKESPRKSGFNFLPIKNPAVLLPLAASVLLVVAISWLLFEVARLGRELEQERVERAALETNRNRLQEQIESQKTEYERLLQDIENERNRPDPQSQPTVQQPASNIISFALTTGSLRDGGEMKTLTLPLGKKLVRLRASVRSGDYESYSALLQTAEGKEVSNHPGLKPQSRDGVKYISILVFANKLDEDDYILAINGITSSGETGNAGEYAFRIVKK